MVANEPRSKGADRLASPPTNARVVYVCPLACTRHASVISPHWLSAPSSGQTSGAAARGRALAASARMKQALKLS
jgi:hypothetical protein